MRDEVEIIRSGGREQNASRRREPIVHPSPTGFNIAGVEWVESVGIINVNLPLEVGMNGALENIPAAEYPAALPRLRLRHQHLEIAGAYFVEDVLVYSSFAEEIRSIWMRRNHVWVKSKIDPVMPVRIAISPDVGRASFFPLRPSPSSDS